MAASWPHRLFCPCAALPPPAAVCCYAATLCQCWAGGLLGAGPGLTATSVRHPQCFAVHLLAVCKPKEPCMQRAARTCDRNG